MKKQLVLVLTLFVLLFQNIMAQKEVMDNFFDKFTYTNTQKNIKDGYFANERGYLQALSSLGYVLSYDLYDKKYSCSSFDYNIVDNTIFKGLKSRTSYYSILEKRRNTKRVLYKIDNYDKEGMLYKQYYFGYYNGSYIIESDYDTRELQSIWQYRKNQKNTQTYLMEYDSINKIEKKMNFYKKGDTSSVETKAYNVPYTEINYQKSRRGNIKYYSFTELDPNGIGISYSKKRREKLTSYSSTYLDENNNRITYTYSPSRKKFSTYSINNQTQWIRRYKRCKKDSVLKEYSIYTYNEQGQNEKITTYKKNGQITRETTFNCNPLGEEAKSKSIQKKNICRNIISNQDGSFYTLYFEETNKKKQSKINKVIAIYNADSTIQQIKTYTNKNQLYDSLYFDKSHLYVKRYYRQQVFLETLIRFNEERFLSTEILKTKKLKFTNTKRNIDYFYDDKGLLTKIIDKGYDCCKKKKKNKTITTNFVNDYY